MSTIDSRCPFRTALRRLLLPLDLLLAFVFAVMVFPVLWIMPAVPKRKRLLSFVPGTSVAMAKEKVGADYRQGFFEDTGGGFFEVVTLFLFPQPERRADHHWTSDRDPATVHVLERTPAFGVFYALGLAWMITEAVWRVKWRGVSLIRGRDPYFYAAMAWVTSAITRVPFVFSVHTDYELLYSADPRHRPKIPLSVAVQEWISRRVLRRARLAMPIRESMSDFLAARGVERARIHVIPHGVELAPYDRPKPDPRLKFGLKSGKSLIVSACRVTLDNYCHHIPDIVESLWRDFPDVLFVIAGPGWDLERMRDLTIERKLEPFLRWLGPVEHEDILALWDKSTVGLVMKGGYSLIEACVSGCAIVSYNIEWHYELIEDGVTGRLVPPDAARAADAIKQLLNDEATRRKFSDAVKSRARDRHSLDAAISARRAAYSRALE